MPTDTIWTYAPDTGPVEGRDLTGCTVAARDGTVGQVDRQGDRFGMRHLVVDTGVWLFGRSVLVPAGVVTGVDTEHRRITVACTRGQIKAAPGFRTDSETLDPRYLATVGDYYRRLPPQATTSE